VADPARIRAALGWTPRHSSLETIVQTAWRWHCDLEPAAARATAPGLRTVS
jgi:UDP-glucose 4-epimerase